MRKNHSKIVCIKLVHLPYLYIIDYIYIYLYIIYNLDIYRYISRLILHKMADVVCGTKCCATNLLNNSTSNVLRDCAKCAKLEIQLQQVREELSSN